ncbi:dimethylsulfonioproprionate lyase family protein [uncultured Roseovarius sp.]|uniref:dimethylsulfonioproprionate lyase family protein n=1 Tax=Roseovarius sp. TaxID=1486281 RepID=UPI0025EF0284|nr:dimethylsulfonioproprionate lyase family protein [uncultured Roseovarius sp.]
MSAPHRLNAFLHAAGDRFAAHDSDIARQISGALKITQSAPPALPGATLPACSVLPDLLSASQDDLAALLIACAGDLHWRCAGFGKLAPGTEQKLAVTEIIGPNAMFPHSRLRFGLLIQREGFHYPRHRHAAEELYLILGGTAHWAAGDQPHAPRAPGGFVHHTSLQPHSMITRTEPMLAMWGWAGDIEGASYSL